MCVCVLSFSVVVVCAVPNVTHFGCVCVLDTLAAPFVPGSNQTVAAGKSWAMQCFPVFDCTDSNWFRSSGKLLLLN